MARNRSAIARGTLDKVLDGEGRIDRSVKKKISDAKNLRPNFKDPVVAYAAGLKSAAVRADHLNPKQQAFVENYTQNGLSKYSAAKVAGYSSPMESATRQLENPKVVEAIANERKVYETAVGMTRKRVMEGLLESIDLAKMKADPLSMVAGWREIAKICGYYEPVKHKIEVSVNGQVLMQQLQSLPDDELLRLADESLEGEFTEVAPE